MRKPFRTPLFQQVADILRKEIEALPPGSRLDTDQGLSRRFSVSVSVVREAVSLLRRDGLVQRHVGRGTFVAAPKERTETAPSADPKPVAILFDLDTFKTRNASLLERLQVSKVLFEKRGFETAIYLGDHIPASSPPVLLTCQQFLKDLARHKFGGVLAVWAFPSEEWMAKAKEYDIPVVGFSLLHENVVTYDFGAYIKLALEALKARNRTRIAYINGVGEWNIDGFDLERRKQVFALFKDAGVDIYPHWFKQDWHPLTPGAAWSQFREVWTQKSERPDGLIIGSPRIWAEIQQGIESFGLKIGEDLDVTLAMGSEMQNVQSDAVITVPFDQNVMISEAVELLSNLMAGKAPPSNRILINAWGAPMTHLPKQRTSLIRTP